MNRLEFNTVMEVLGIKNHEEAIEKYFYKDQIYYWNDLKISFPKYGNDDDTEIEGKIPLDFLKIIDNKYPNKIYEIIGRGIEYLKISIHFKERLIIFLTEIKDYLARKNNLPETEVQRYDELITETYSKMLKQLNPSLSGYEWLRDKKNCSSIFDNIFKEKETTLGKMFRQAIDDFDMSVNPYMNPNIELDNIENYLKKVKIGISVAPPPNPEYGSFDACRIKIEKINSDGFVCYRRFYDGFEYKLSTDDLKLIHKIVDYYDWGKSEIIELRDDKKRISIEYTVNERFDGWICGIPVVGKPTIEQIGLIYDKLIEAKEYASSITLANNKEEKGKEMVIQKPKNN